jgi:hypothetical protein
LPDVQVGDDRGRVGLDGFANFRVQV